MNNFLLGPYRLGATTTMWHRAHRIFHSDELRVFLVCAHEVRVFEISFNSAVRFGITFLTSDYLLFTFNNKAWHLL